MYIVLRPETSQYELISGVNLLRVADSISVDNNEDRIDSVFDAIVFLYCLGWKIGSC